MCQYTLVRWTLVLFTVVVLFFGISLISLGIWSFISPQILETLLSERYKVLIEIASILCIIVGGIVSVIAFCGCCGAALENRCLLGFYIVILILITIISILTIVPLVLYMPQVKNKTITYLNDKLMNNYNSTWPPLKNRYVDSSTNSRVVVNQPESTPNYVDTVWNQIVDYMQEKHNCCGVTTNTTISVYEKSLWKKHHPNRLVPWSCCVLIASRDCFETKTWPTPSVYHSQGCLTRYERLANNNMLYIYIACGIYGFILLMSIIIALILMCPPDYHYTLVEPNYEV